MKSFIKKIRFLIDQRYAGHVKQGKPFHPLGQPTMIGLYILAALGKPAVFSGSKKSRSLSWKSELMRALGHTYYPEKFSLPELSVQGIFERRFDFSFKENPKVSFLVVCGNSLSKLVRLLESIKDNGVGITIELILMEDGAQEEVTRFIQRNIRGGAIYKTSESGDLLSSINLAVSRSKGEFFAVLRPSVLIQSNWLSELLKGVSNYPDIGIASGKVLSSDGLLDEAGTIIDAGFRLKNYGKSDLPDRPKYNFTRDLEYTTGSNTLIRKMDFENSGGFDADLSSLPLAFCRLSISFRIDLGKRILYVPQAKVIRYAMDEDAGLTDVSRFLIDNKKLIARSPDKRHNVRNFFNRRTVLFVDIGLPEYDKDSGSVRAFHLLGLMRELGNHVIVVPRKGQVSSPYLEELQRLGIEVLYAFPDREGMKQELIALLPNVDIAWICRPQLNVEFEWIFKRNPRIKWVFDTIDLHYVRLAREGELFGSKRLMKKSARFKKLELGIACRADLTLTVTEDEKNLLMGQGIKNVAVLPNIHENHEQANFPGFSQREGLLFIGSYQHPPNVDAVKWLVREIMPIVWEEFRIPVTLLGSAPDKEVKALETDLVTVPGYVKDVEPFFTSHRVFVAPLRYGAGMKGKIGQSLSYHLPIVTTTIGAEGVGLTHNVDVLIADDKEAFAQQIINIYQDRDLWKKLAGNSKKVLSNYSPEHIKENLRAMIEGLR